MQVDWSALLLVIAGGVIGIAGGLLTAIVSNGLATTKARRDDLLAAYVEWTRAIFHAIHESELLWMYDAIESMKKENPDELDSVPSSTSGRTRQEHVKEFLIATDALRAAEARPLLLERRPKLRRKVSELSNMSSPTGPGTMSGGEKFQMIVLYIESKRTGVREFLEETAGSASGF